MAWKGVHVVDPLHLPRRGSSAAHAGTESDADAGRAALERPQHQLAVDIAVEAGPVEVRNVSQINAAALAMLATASLSPATRPSSALARSRYMVGASAAAILKS